MIKDRFSSIVFPVAGIYGFIVRVPGFFGEKILAEKMPPAIMCPEFFYGLLGAAVAWQVAFLIIARDPQHFWPIIPAAILENLCIALLFVLGRVPLIVALGGAGEFVLGTLYRFLFEAQNDAHNPIIGGHFCRLTSIRPLVFRQLATCPRSLTNFLAA